MQLLPHLKPGESPPAEADGPAAFGTELTHGNPNPAELGIDLSHSAIGTIGGKMTAPMGISIMNTTNAETSNTAAFQFLALKTLYAADVM